MFMFLTQVFDLYVKIYCKNANCCCHGSPNWHRLTGKSPDIPPDRSGMWLLTVSFVLTLSTLSVSTRSLPGLLSFSSSGLSVSSTPYRGDLFSVRLTPHDRPPLNRRRAMFYKGDNNDIRLLFLIDIFTPFMTAVMSGGGAFSLDFPNIRFMFERSAKTRTSVGHWRVRFGSATSSLSKGFLYKYSIKITMFDRRHSRKNDNDCI